MGFFKKIKKAFRQVDRVLTGRGKAGKWNPFAAAERYIVRPARHRIGFSRSSLFPRSGNSAVNINAGLPSASYIPGTGFKRYV